MAEEESGEVFDCCKVNTEKSGVIWIRYREDTTVSTALIQQWFVPRNTHEGGREKRMQRAVAEQAGPDLNIHVLMLTADYCGRTLIRTKLSRL